MVELSKRRRSVFEAIQEIDSEDVQAEKLRRKRSTMDVAQAKAAQSQIKVYASLLECRILLQRVLTATTTTTKTKEQDDSPSSEIKNVQEECNQILEMLFKARISLMGEEFMSAAPVDYGRLLQTSNTNSPSDEQLPQVLQNEYESCREYWKEVLNRRYKDLRLHAGLTSAKQAQFRVLDSTFWQQVDATVLTHEEPRNRETNDPDISTAFAFDDSKLYRHMLQDFVSLSSSSTARGEEMAAQRLRRSNNNNNSTAQRKQVDRKASKGRKIRYATIPKLVNFTFPMTRPQHPSSAMLDENEWFQSLFGGGAAGKNA